METIAFARGIPAPEMLPVDDLRAATERAFDGDATAMLSYGTGSGWPPLCTLLAQRHGVPVDQVVVTSGSLQGFAMLAQVLVERAAAEGRRARMVVECPTYDRPLLMLQRLGVDVVGVPTGADGIDIEALDVALEGGADLLYVIPTFQNPSGGTLTTERRAAVLELARRHDVLVLEDDPYGLLHFEDAAPASLFDQRGDTQVAFSGSFSKTVAPGLRVGWLVLPADIAGEVATRANDTYISSSFLSQAAICEYFAAGAFEPNVERMRALLRERCRRMVEALRRELPDATFTPPGGGYFAWVRLPDDVDVAEVVREGAALGVSFIPGASFGAGCEQFVRLAFSSPPLDSIDTGVQRLAAACAAARQAAVVTQA